MDQIEAKAREWLEEQLVAGNTRHMAAFARSILAEYEQGGWLRCKEDCDSVTYKKASWPNNTVRLPCTCGNPMKAKEGE